MQITVIYFLNNIFMLDLIKFIKKLNSNNLNKKIINLKLIIGDSVFL